MANYAHTQDIVNDALHKVGELSDGTSDFDAKALEYVNKWHLSILGGSNELGIELGEPWVWAKNPNPGVLILKAPYETGTVSLTNGSINGDFSSAPTLSQVGKILKVTGHEDYFRIATHTAATTAFTLDALWTGDSGAGQAFKAHQLEYDLPTAILRLIAPMRSHRKAAQIEQVGYSQFQKDFPLALFREGHPTHFTQMTESTAGLIRVRFNGSVTEDTRVEFDRIDIPADLTDSTSSFPMIPREHRIALVYGAAYNLAIDKNDGRFAEYRELTKAALMAMSQASKQEMKQSNRNMAAFFPRMEQTSLKRRFSAEDYS